jgi:large subunit ribosomal protein L9
MEVLLLTDITGVGKKNDLIVVRSGYALNNLLPLRKALVVTPNVRKRYAEQIKSRALEREKEKELVSSLASALSGKVIHIEAKATKTGKLYAALHEEAIVEALAKEHGISLPSSALSIQEHIKTAGIHTVTVTVGTKTQNVNVEVKAIVA